jgi:hypothetical protein
MEPSAQMHRGGRAGRRSAVLRTRAAGGLVLAAGRDLEGRPGSATDCNRIGSSPHGRSGGSTLRANGVDGRARIGRESHRRVRWRADARRPVRFTRRGRLVLLTLLVMLCAVVVGLLAGPGQAADPAGPRRTAVVQPGDTLWSFTARNAPSSDPFGTIDEIRRLNNLDGYVIHPGQRLVLPRRW